MLKVKRIFGLLVTLFILVVVMGCTSEESSETAGETEVPVQDPIGFDITVPEEIDGIISLAPSITVILIDLGLEDQIIAMDTQSAFSLGNERGLPELDMLAPEIESMIALDPDFVFASAMIMMGDEESDPLSALKDLDIGVAYIPSSDSIVGIQEDIRFIAAVVGETEAGDELISEMERTIEEVIALIGDVEVAPTVYFEISPAPDMFSFGNGVFLHEMLELIGAENIFADMESWMAVEAESVVTLNPDVIFTNVDFIDDSVAEILARPGWEGMNAVINERVYFIDNNDTSLPTHHITRGLRAMAMYLYDLNE